MANFLNNILFIFQRLNWLSVLDILLVTLIFYVILYSLRDTQAMVLLRGVIFLVVALVLLTTLVNLPAFSWLIQSMLRSRTSWACRHICSSGASNII
jgi:diadenylate cyclase